MGEVWALQLAPPFVVARMTPPSPTAQASEALAHATPLRSELAGEVCPVQVVPPLVVATRLPKAPTAQASEALAQVTA